MLISKSCKINVIDTLEYLCRRTGISEYSLGIIIRSYHYSVPAGILLIMSICSKETFILLLIFYIIIIILYLLFDGCIISMLENRLCKDNFNVIDPFIELNGLAVDSEIRKMYTQRISIIYTSLIFLIFYIRFILKV